MYLRFDNSSAPLVPSEHVNTNMSPKLLNDLRNEKQLIMRAADVRARRRRQTNVTLNPAFGTSESKHTRLIKGSRSVFVYAQMLQKAVWQFDMRGDDRPSSVSNTECLGSAEVFTNSLQMLIKTEVGTTTRKSLWGPLLAADFPFDIL